MATEAAQHHTGGPATRGQRILLCTTCTWPLTARLAIAFGAVGCSPEVLCPAGNPAWATGSVSRRWSYEALAPLRSFRNCIENGAHDLIVPCDDLAVTHLNSLYESECRAGRTSGPLCELLQESLGDPDSLKTVAIRSALLRVAREEGIRVPISAPINSIDDMDAWGKENGYPAVIKADGTGGGRGVRVANTPQEARSAFRLLSHPGLARVIKRMLADRDSTWILPFLGRRRTQLTVQRFVPGTDGTISISCWKGRLLASIGFEVVKHVRPNGPASVLRVIENPQMSEAAERLVRRLNLSGLYGLDFKMDDRNRAWLLEMNPRPTQSSHLRIGEKGDLVGSLIFALSAKRAPTPPKSGEISLIALFPGEWEANAESEFLATAFHDVPWSEPGLVGALVKNRQVPLRMLSKSKPAEEC